MAMEKENRWSGSAVPDAEDGFSYVDVLERETIKHHVSASS